MGWIFNLADPNALTDGPEITAVATVMTALALTAVLLRLYVRLGIIKAPGIDDWLIIFAWITSAGFAIITIIQTRYGLGLISIKDLPPQDVYEFGLLQFVGAPFYISSILGFKISLLCSYLRFIPRGAYRWATYVVMVLTVLFHLSFLIVQINLCSPIAAQWDPTVTDFTCLPSVTVYTTMASLTMLFDVTVMLLPFPVLMSLNMQNRKKIVLLGLFGLGIFITIIQIIRIMTVKRLAVYTDSAPLILWSTVEANLGIIVVCIPCLSPLFKYFKDRTFSGSRKSKKTYDIGSQYALRTWKATRMTSDQRTQESLDMGNEASARADVTDNTDSMEFILEPTKIVRKTEVTITRS